MCIRDREIPLKGKTKVEVVMEDDAQALEEVVVIGYGTACLLYTSLFVLLTLHLMAK